MGPLLMECFALEVLYNQGGYHVPLALPWQDQSSVLALSDSSDLAPIVAPNLDPWEKGNPFSQENIDAGFVENEPLGIVGASAGSGQLLQRIKALLDKTDSPMTCKEIYPRMLVPLDSQTSYMEFPDWSRFLGADMFFDVCDSDQTERDVVWLASTFVVTTCPCFSTAHALLPFHAVPTCIHRRRFQQAPLSGLLHVGTAYTGGGVQEGATDNGAR